jgi:3-hydroxyisobutyrate dehydrogenase-like beta-hydroxyacid dehydrogenase
LIPAKISSMLDTMDPAPCPPAPPYRVGFIGLGLIGLPMAERLARCAAELVVWNRTAAKADGLVAGGALRARDVPDLVASVEVVVTCLHGPDSDREVYLGPDGLLSGGAAGKLFINTSTIGPDCARELAEATTAAGADYVDAALMGRGAQSAAAGTLVLPVAGPSDAIERARPVTAMLATTVEHMGPVGAAQVVKLANNVQVAVGAASLAQALRFAIAAGVKPEALSRILPLGSSSSRAMDLWLNPMLEGRTGSNGTLRTLGKDVQLAAEYAASQGEPATIATAAAQVFARALAHGGEHLDVPALVGIRMDPAQGTGPEPSA